MLMRSFVAVAEAVSFSEAARRLGLQQSTISQHVQKLEEAVGRSLMERTTQKIELTPNGIEMLDMARDILTAYERIGRRFEAKQLSGTIRIGSVEDFSIVRMPQILINFRRLHPGVQIELVVAPMSQLHEMLRQGTLDLMIGIRRVGSQLGRFIRKERVIWYNMGRNAPDTKLPLPLVLYSAPNVLREVVIEACERSGRLWYETGSASSYLGLRAATLAGLGLLAVGESAELSSIPAASSAAGLPSIEDVELILMRREDSSIVREISEMIMLHETGSVRGQDS